MTLVRKLVVAILLGFFGLSCHQNTERFFRRIIGVSETTQNKQELLYPSVTMCPISVAGMKLAYANNNLADTVDFESVIPKPNLLFLKHDVANRTTFTVTAFNSSNWKPLKFSSVSAGPQRCITYNPPESSPTGVYNSLILKLNVTGLVCWTIALHHKDHFVPSTGNIYGSEVIMSNSPHVHAPGSGMMADIQDQWTLYDLEKTDLTQMNERNHPCVEDRRVNWNACFANYLERNLNCTLPWRTKTGKSKCNTKGDLMRMKKLIADFSHLDAEAIGTETGCYPACKRSEFVAKMVSMKSGPPASNDTVTATVQMFYSGSRYTEKEEYLTFGVQDWLDTWGYWSATASSPSTT